MADGSRLLYVDGSWRESASGATFVTLNPATNEPLTEVAQGGKEDVDAAVDAARETFQGKAWRQMDPSERGRILFRMGALLRERSEELLRMESLDNGKTLREARSDVAYTIRLWEYFAGLADKVEGKTIPVPGLRFDYTRVEALGVTAHVVPWNYPLVLGCRGMAPALAAGNTVVVKPSSLAPLTTLALAEIGAEAGLPPGVLNAVPGTGAEAGRHLVSHEGIDSITFTGSQETGKEVMRLAAEHVTPVTLELGGKCPNVVMGDADQARAVRGVLRGIFTNAGQMCWAGSRLLLQESVRDAFLSDVKEGAEGLILGPGVEEGSQMGPLVSPAQADQVLDYVEIGKEEGATLLTGGGRGGDHLAKGNFVEPTVFADVSPEMRIATEEIFGPVLSALTFRDAEEAVELANRSEYGLCAGVWTRNLSLAHRLAAELDAGTISINEYPVTFPQTPFGGFKESGIGHEQGLDAVYQYCRVKSVNVNLL